MATIAKSKPRTLPNDPLGGQNDHLSLIGVGSVYGEVSGAGVDIAIIDDGVQSDHPDLAAAYDASRDLDALSNGSSGDPQLFGDDHGTVVAGIAAARGNNGEGAFGVAWNATISGIRMPFEELSEGTVDDEPSFYTRAFTRAGQFDVANNSWGLNDGSYNVLNGAFTSIFAPIRAAVADGRGGLGTVFLFAAGNERQDGEDTNYSNLTNLHEVIAVAATTESGKLANYSNPGATVLVAAPAASFGTDRTGRDGYNNGRGGDIGDADYTDTFGGTSAATPVTSGVVALMLEAEPGLGYRDVKEILAYSASAAGSANGYQRNGAVDWNGGGLHVSHDYGFGLLDAHASVRLAQTWLETGENARTEATLVRQTTAGVRDGGATISDDAVVEFDFTVAAGTLDVVEEVELDLAFTHEAPGDLRITLLSPSGTESILVDRPGSEVDFGSGFRFGSNQMWGEDPSGTWTLRIEDLFGGDEGTASSASLSLLGHAPDSDDRYVFTDDYKRYPQVGGPLIDSGGNDVFNLAGMTAKSKVSLDPGFASKIAGKTFLIGDGVSIEDLFGGDGADTLVGNALANLILGQGGRDKLYGGDGDDELDGGSDRDTIDGGAGTDTVLLDGLRADFVFASGKKGVTVTDTIGNGGVDTLVDVELARFTDQTVSIEVLLATA